MEPNQTQKITPKILWKWRQEWNSWQHLSFVNMGRPACLSQFPDAYSKDLSEMAWELDAYEKRQRLTFLSHFFFCPIFLCSLPHLLFSQGPWAVIKTSHCGTHSFKGGLTAHMIHSVAFLMSTRDRAALRPLPGSYSTSHPACCHWATIQASKKAKLAFPLPT